MNALSSTPMNTLRSVYMEPAESPIAYQRDALDYWNRLRGERFAPRWTEISLVDFPPRVIPTIAVLDIGPGGRATKYRLWGSQLVAMHGRDYTGF